MKVKRKFDNRGRAITRSGYRHCKKCGWDTSDPHPGEICRWCDNKDITATVETGTVVARIRDIEGNDLTVIRVMEVNDYATLKCYDNCGGCPNGCEDSKHMPIVGPCTCCPTECLELKGYYIRGNKLVKKKVIHGKIVFKDYEEGGHSTADNALFLKILCISFGYSVTQSVREDDKYEYIVSGYQDAYYEKMKTLIKDNREMFESVEFTKEVSTPSMIEEFDLDDCFTSTLGTIMMDLKRLENCMMNTDATLPSDLDLIKKIIHDLEAYSLERN